ncbi:hypothetical protein ACT3UQ_08670 [Glutamicibacter sp. AOP12-B1-11]|uniref:hypothetical protein n=1 Tax=Glutamicibacter sp. AOP12-B1-11 TaxID=3457725 RepID=UPI004034DBFC
MSLAVIPQPYPDREPWLDLHEYAINNWYMLGPSSSFNFLAKVTANEVTLQLHTRGGTARQIVSALPDELLPEVGGSSVRYWTLPAFQYGVGTVVLELHADGTLHIPYWGGGIADGTNKNVVCQATYVRRAA